MAGKVVVKDDEVTTRQDVKIVAYSFPDSRKPALRGPSYVESVTSLTGLPDTASIIADSNIPANSTVAKG